MHGKLTPSSEAGTKIPQRPNPQDAAAQETAQKRDAAADAQIDVERVREDDGAGGQCGATQVVGGEQRGGVLRVREGEVHEYTLKSGVALVMDGRKGY